MSFFLEIAVAFDESENAEMLESSSNIATTDPESDDIDLDITGKC